MGLAQNVVAAICLIEGSEPTEAYHEEMPLCLVPRLEDPCVSRRSRAHRVP
jgi:hypothetical protein